MSNETEQPSSSSSSSSSSSIFYNGTFSEFGLNPKLVESIQVRLGHSKPTLVQSKTIPEILAGKDVLVKANTGSGKTLSYLIPIVNLLLNIKVDRAEGTYALIIAPTRELCLQIYSVLRKLIEPFPYLVPGNLMGGEKKKSEKARLRKGITILVGTPGRLIDHLETTNCFKIHLLKWLILDEADMLLELGFEKSVKRIISMLDEKKDPNGEPRQSGLFSATLHKGVQRLAAVTLNTHSYIESEDQPSTDDTEDAISPDKIYQTPSTLNQKYVVVETKRRLLALFFFSFCRIKEDQKLVIFVSNISAVEFLHSLFAHLELPSYDGPITLQEGKSLFKLHGDMSQVDRTKIYFSFGKAKAAILVCTDVAARGLDLPKINWIVQFDPPTTTSEYIHRVGRTARKGEKGNSLIFLLQNEANYAEVLQSHKLTLTELSIDEIYAEAFDSRLIKTHPMEFVFSMQKNIETMLQEDKDLENLARDAYTSTIRAYATHSHKSVFSIRTIHLGHFASSFGLLEAPTQIGRHADKNQKFLKPTKAIGKDSQIKGRGSKRLGVQKWLQKEMKKKEVRAQIRDSSSDGFSSMRYRNTGDEFSAGF